MGDDTWSGAGAVDNVGTGADGLKPGPAWRPRIVTPDSTSTLKGE